MKRMIDAALVAAVVAVVALWWTNSRQPGVDTPAPARASQEPVEAPAAPAVSHWRYTWDYEPAKIDSGRSLARVDSSYYYAVKEY